MDRCVEISALDIAYLINIGACDFDVCRCFWDVWTDFFFLFFFLLVNLLTPDFWRGQPFQGKLSEKNARPLLKIRKLGAPH